MKAMGSSAIKTESTVKYIFQCEIPSLVPNKIIVMILLNFVH